MVEINFKSGKTIRVDAKEFSVEKRGNDLTSITWGGLKKPKQILFIKLDEIETIVKVK